MTKTFGELLTKYMHRIGMSEQFLGHQIGVTGATINKWKNELAKPSKKNRHLILEAAKVLRLTEQETNALLIAASFSGEYPIEELAAAIFTDFIPGLFDRLERCFHPVMLLLTQATWGEPPCREALLLHAAKKYGGENVWHIQPPYILEADTDMYFADLGKQCGLRNVDDGNSFAHAFEERLEQSNLLFLLISRFEHSEPLLREKLAKIIRAISDRHANRLHVIFCGGASLADLKFKQGAMSLLNLAEIQRWPELGRVEVQALAKYRFEELQLNNDLADELLNTSGAHPLLLNDCLKIRHDHPNFALDKYTRLLSKLDYVWQLFTPFRQDSRAKKQIGEWLEQEHLGEMQPYILDDLKRQLYWKNLLVGKELGGMGEEIIKKKYLCWRCEAIQMAGREVLGVST